MMSLGYSVMKKTALIIFTILLVPASLFAGRQEGILQEFRKAEEAIRSRGTRPEDLKKTLEGNLMRGVRQTILRQFYPQKDEYLKDLNPESMGYENPTSPLVYYVKYKNMIIRFDFASNPEKFIQAPILKKVLILDEEIQKQVEQETGNAPAGGTGTGGGAAP